MAAYDCVRVGRADGPISRYDTSYHHTGGAGGSGFIGGNGVTGGEFMHHASPPTASVPTDGAVATNKPGYLVGVGAGGAINSAGGPGLVGPRLAAPPPPLCRPVRVKLR